jgi:iron complex transport system substrate-binding protein
MGEPEDLFGCSRTVFGVKIMCGLILPINPQSSREDWGFLFDRQRMPVRLKGVALMANTRKTITRGLLAVLIFAVVGGQAFCFPVKAKDDRGKEFEFIEPPRRIVSLVPTQTELLYSLGLEENIVGVTSNCSYPQAAQSKERVGAFLEFDMDKIMALNPDLILAFGSVQLPAVKALEKKGKKVFWIYPHTVSDILASFERVGEITGKVQEGKRLRDSAARKADALRSALGVIPDEKRPSVFRVMGLNPPSTIGADSFQSDVFYLAGGKNAFADVKKDFFEVDPDELVKRDPDVVIICGDDETASKHSLLASPVYGKLTAVKKGSILVIPCDLTCRPGPRIMETAERIARYLYPDKFVGKP